jgi:hypothetical protein
MTQSGHSVERYHGAVRRVACGILAANFCIVARIQREQTDPQQQENVRTAGNTALPNGSRQRSEGTIAYFRWYGPIEPFYNKSWSLPDIVLTN